MREAAAAADLGNRSRVHQPIRSESRDHGQPIRGDVCVFFLLEGWKCAQARHFVRAPRPHGVESSGVGGMGGRRGWGGMEGGGWNDLAISPPPPLPM